MPKYNELLTYHKMLTASASKKSIDDTILVGLPPVLRGKAKEALKLLGSFDRVIVAFSGGIDSTLVAYLAALAVKKEVLAVTASSPSLASSDLRDAKRIATEIGIKHLVIRTEELDDPSYVSNPANRCYFCKKELSEKLKQLSANKRFSTIVDGTNADDLLGHRPGAAALVEGGVRRPLAEVGMTKTEVRELARVLGLPNSDKPSSPCLSSRIQYGQKITPERLMRIEKSEAFIRNLTGAKELRVRDHGDLARIEVGRDERRFFFDETMLDDIGMELRNLGFRYVCFDLIGYRSGSMNESLTPDMR